MPKTRKIVSEVEHIERTPFKNSGVRVIKKNNRQVLDLTRMPPKQREEKPVYQDRLSEQFKAQKIRANASRTFAVMYR